MNSKFIDKYLPWLITSILCLLVIWKISAPSANYFVTWSFALPAKNEDYNVDKIVKGCDIVRGKSCFSIHLSSETLNYPEAAYFCKSDEAVMASITDRAIYNGISDSVRAKMLPGYQAMSIWVEVSPDIEEMHELWYLDDTKSRNPSYNNVYMVVDKEKASKSQGLRFGFALSTLRGVVCQRQL